VTTVEDAITGEIVRSGLVVAAEEASIVVVRAGHSAHIQEGADACAAVLDADGQLVALSTATSLMHAASLRCSLPALVEDFPLESMVPGDVYALNDPYRGGIHANDILVFRPVFADGRVTFFAGTLIHVADVGGVSAAGLAALATDTFVEGLLLPPVHLACAGEPADDVLRIISRNSRTPEKVAGDVQALMAGVNVIARRIEELQDRFGAEVVARCAQRDIDDSERRMRKSLAELPAGRYEGSFVIDSDGIESREFEVRVAVTLDGEGGVEVDCAGTSPQAKGAINSSISQTLSGIVFAIRCFADPSIAMNEGCFRPLEVHLPRGSLVNPEPPAACGGRLVTVAAATEAILAALARARPGGAVAASSLIQVYALSGSHPDGSTWLNLLYEFGGLGARAGGDGPDATGAFFLGGRSVIPQVEPLEAQYPFVVRSARLLPDSGGPGTWRGGLGVETVIELLAEARLTVRGDRLGGHPPPGAQGGEAGRPGSFSIERADGRVEQLAARQTDVHLAPRDRFVLRTSGGGGLGPARDRDPTRVRDDVATGKVTREGAARDYGIQP
jgi:N-methylhydantoinase B